MDNFNTVPLSDYHKASFLKFADLNIGKNYFNSDNFKTQLELSQHNNLNSSYVLQNKDGQIIGVRLTYAPGNWQNHIKTMYLNNLNIDPNKVAYFKSLFIDNEYQGQKLGPYLSETSIKTLELMCATHILSHSWLESPNNSSAKYLEKSGFKSLGLISNFWADCDYLCSGCNKKPCTCSAQEMILEIQKAPK